MANHIAFRFDWHEVLGAYISNVLGLNADVMDDGTARWEAVAICLDRTAIMVTVEPDTDQMILSLGDWPSDNGWAPISSFDFAISRPLGWSWLGINSQGYKDSFTIALGAMVPDALQPRFMFLAEASSLTGLDLIPHRAIG